jgi:hypothetical protein
MAAQDKLALMRDRATRWKATQRIDEHEQDVYIVTTNSDFDSTMGFDPEVTLLKIAPRPRVVSKPIRAITDGQSQGTQVVSVHLYEVTDISRVNITEQQLRDANCFLVMKLGAAPDPALVPKGEYARYKISGKVESTEKYWKVMLEENKDLKRS